MSMAMIIILFTIFNSFIISHACNHDKYIPISDRSDCHYIKRDFKKLIGNWRYDEKSMRGSGAGSFDAGVLTVYSPTDDGFDSELEMTYGGGQNLQYPIIVRYYNDTAIKVSRWNNIVYTGEMALCKGNSWLLLGIPALGQTMIFTRNGHMHFSQTVFADYNGERAYLIPRRKIDMTNTRRRIGRTFTLE